MPLFVYRHYDPEYRNTVTLDCYAETPEAALKSAVRWVRRKTRRLRRVLGNKAPRMQFPGHVSFLKEIMPDGTERPVTSPMWKE